MEPGLLSPSQRLDWLRLARSENVGPRTFDRLLARFGSPGRALEALPELCRRGGGNRPLRICTEGEARREAETVEKLGGTLLCRGEAGYPPLLAAIDDAPPVLVLQGDGAVLRRPAIAVVGARNASIAGQRLARNLASDLGRAGVTIVSGLARGIDTAAHEAALPSGTVAVVAGGVDIVYPPENARLQAAIRERGAVISEMPPGTVPQARHFPRRNRLISGLSLGVLVVEASLRSGSLITARMAGEQGRELFAVPGSPLEPRSRGANQLLRDGAVLVETADDILSVLGGLPLPRLDPASSPGQSREADGPAPPSLPDEARRSVLAALSAAPVSVDEILRRCQLSPGVLSLVLLELEMAGRLARHSGHRVSILS